MTINQRDFRREEPRSQTPGARGLSFVIREQRCLAYGIKGFAEHEGEDKVDNGPPYAPIPSRPFWSFSCSWASAARSFSHSQVTLSCLVARRFFLVFNTACSERMKTAGYETNPESSDNCLRLCPSQRCGQIRSRREEARNKKSRRRVFRAAPADAAGAKGSPPQKLKIRIFRRRGCDTAGR